MKKKILAIGLVVAMAATAVARWLTSPILIKRPILSLLAA